MKNNHMENFWKIFLIILGILALLAVVWLAATLYFFTGVSHDVPAPIYSQDGSKVMIPSVGYDKNLDTYLEVSIEIQDVRSGKTLYQVNTQASHRMKWFIHWVDENTIQLDSSDIGTYCWKEERGVWAEAKCP